MQLPSISCVQPSRQLGHINRSHDRVSRVPNLFVVILQNQHETGFNSKSDTECRALGRAYL
jgi:hypothetical protein